MKYSLINVTRLKDSFADSRFSSYRQLSSASGVTQPTISRLLSRKIHRTKPPIVAKLAKALGVNTEWLMGDVSIKENSAQSLELLLDKWEIEAEIMGRYATTGDLALITQLHMEQLKSALPSV